MSSVLTPEQKRKIEENRRLALERLAAKRANNSGGSASSSIPVQHGSSPKPCIPTYTKPVTHYNSNEVMSNKFQSFSKFKKTFPSSAKSEQSAPKTWNNLSTGHLCGSLYLRDKDHFTVDIPYDSKVIDFFKSIPGREYDSVKRKWYFPLSQYNDFKEQAKSLGPMCTFGNLPSAVLKIFCDKKSQSDQPVADTELKKIEPQLMETLFPFQIEGVKFGISKKGKCIIADDMGLGKTIQALAIADYYKSDWPLLIVCPSSMRFQWEEEVHKNLPSLPSYRTLVVVNRKDYIENPSVLIISYDLMGKMKDFLKSYGFGVVILDESHSLKSNKTQRTKAALELCSKCKRVILLSGTPALSRPAELFTQIKLVDPSLFKDMIEYGVRYCEGKQDRFGWNFNGSSNLDELKEILDSRIMIRRLKADVLDQLPSKMRHVVILDSDNVNTKSKSMDAYAKKLGQGLIKGSEKRTTLLSYFSETGRAKVKAICQHVEKVLEQNIKFLIFGHHKDVLDAICETLEAKETYYIRIDGSVNSEERKSVCDQFQTEEKYRAAVLSIKAANTGVTLTAANLVIFAELFWNPGELTQAEDRAHRIGQKDSVMVQYLLAKGTADDYLWPLVQSKLNVLSRAGLSKDNGLDVQVTHTHKQQAKEQNTITNYFSEMGDDEDIDETDLNNLLDEIEGVPEKRLKLS